MRRALFLILFLPIQVIPFLLNAQAKTDDKSTLQDASPGASMFGKLIWADECNGTGVIDTSKWFHQTRLPNGSSWFNGEIQHYTNRVDNSFLSAGSMSILAKKETFTDQGHSKSYTSARLNSKFAFKYGKVEIRAKNPFGIGTWPALWMLGKNINENGAYWQLKGFGNTSWPACGEIDIMEHWGSNQNYVQSAVHSPSSHGLTINKGGRNIPTTSSAYHVYAVEWTPDKLVFLIDSLVHYVYQPAVKNAANWPFNAEQYLIMNVAIQGNIDPGFTQSALEIDYVRVYEYTPLSTNQRLKAKELTFYPNPVDDQIRIGLHEEGNQSINISVYSYNGMLVQSSVHKVNGKELVLNELDHLTAGIYFLTFVLEDAPYSIKFSKR